MCIYNSTFNINRKIRFFFILFSCFSVVAFIRRFSRFTHISLYRHKRFRNRCALNWASIYFQNSGENMSQQVKCLQFLLFLLFVFWTETSTSHYRRTRNVYFVRVPWNILCIRCAHDRTFRFHSIHALRLSVYCNRSLDLQSNQLNAIDQIESTDKYYKYCMHMENENRAKEQKCRDWIAFKN